ncbi:solute carrier family 40 member 1-like [Haliotis rubra]|uniref:solute carrier family 40 member 1-like n=1 Tax=Haliotis rubra TaxID=36100 RepID=UPI001EE5DEEE|nr:solute carrier family 40 member 1-like [Haliotis rubra]
MGSCKDFVTGTNFLVYCSHFLSAWGDRMWAFGVGLFLIKISPESLQLTASYGLASGLSVLFLGALIGDWVDNTPRLKAAQLSLVLQNLFVALCAGGVYVNLTYHEDFITMWDGWLQKLVSAVIIILAILANLSSVARMIAVEKDWVVEICGKDKDMLATMTATLRRIDLATKILAPIATGQIMFFTEMRIGAVFIGGWNVVTVFLEYYLIWKVYNTVPSLRKKKYWTKSDKLHYRTSLREGRLSLPLRRTRTISVREGVRERLHDLHLRRTRMINVRECVREGGITHPRTLARTTSLREGLRTQMNLLKDVNYSIKDIFVPSPRRSPPRLPQRTPPRSPSEEYQGPFLSTPVTEDDGGIIFSDSEIRYWMANGLDLASPSKEDNPAHTYLMTDDDVDTLTLTPIDPIAAVPQNLDAAFKTATKAQAPTLTTKQKAVSSEEEVPVANEANTDLPVDGTDDQTPVVRGDNSAHDISDAVEDDEPTASPEKLETSEKLKETEEVTKEEKEEPPSCCGNCLQKMFSSFVVLYKGWRTYMMYDVAKAGLGLACLYMTVLGFDNITTGYAYSQGISESVLGGFMGGAAVIGIIGTLAYPALRRCVGLERTGLFALSAQITCLTLCVMSVWMPGSPFNPYYFFEDHPSSNQTTCSTRAMSVNNSLATASSLAVSFNSSYSSTAAAGLKTPGVTAVPMSVNPGNSTTPGVPGCVEDTGPESYLSIGLLMAGIITARFGLWVADLTITQLFLERVKEHERGKVNGVQNSLNKFMDVLKFILVVALPQPPVFGYLVIVSFAFICLGFGLYASYSRRARGHLLPFHKKCITTEEANQAAAA